MNCLACGTCDDRTRLGSPWCLTHFTLPLEERKALFLERCELDYLHLMEAQAVEGHERKAA